jgi:hypothetical protein
VALSGCGSKGEDMRKIFLLGLITTTCLLVHAGNCRQVAGSVSTNFLDSKTTLGTSTGDLPGAIGVSVLSITPNSDGTVTYYVQHHWVTASGDTINAEAAYLTAFPTGLAGVYAGSYLHGVVINGGTGQFKNATGKTYPWGALDANTGEVTLRYAGTICFDDPERR